MYFDEVIAQLAEAYERRDRRPELFERFCRPIPGAAFGELYAEMRAERKRDERRLSRRE